MPIGSCTQKTGVVGRVLLSRFAKVLDDFALSLLTRHIEIAIEPILGRNDSEQVVNGFCADVSEHLLPFSRRFWKIAHVSF